MKKIILAVLLVSLLISLGYFFLQPEEEARDNLLLLLPEQNSSSLVAKAWRNIAAEEGLHLSVMSNNQFIYSKQLNFSNKYKGIIVPDIVQRQMSEILAKHLKDYVANGGALFLIFDAGTLDTKGNPLTKGSLFKDVLGFDYAKNEALDRGLGTIGHDKKVLQSLNIPPGKCTSVDNSGSDFCAISSYNYGGLTYPYFLTPPIENTDSLLMTTPDHQFIAGVVPLQKGKILYVNLPLTELWKGTDAMLIHSFLRYFAVDLLHLPTLATVPNGVGGIILNLHVESKDALPGFTVLKNIGLFEQGPYSIDFTAGPDLDKVGDKEGLDVLHNPVTQYWIHYLDKLGHAIGSDGGWLHNYYGLNVSNDNEKEFLKYIVMNNEAMEKVLGKKVVEYMPSMGNQPGWATRYLERENFLAYYSASNTGTAPTQNFVDGVFDKPFLWSFPVLPFGKYACLRDFGFAKVPEVAVTDWLLQSTDFMSTKHLSRLIYFHPTDILYFDQYLNSLKAWLAKTKELSKQGLFRWYSMVDMAKFLNARRLVTWSVVRKDNKEIYKAYHPTSLEQQTWFIDKKTCEEPEIDTGLGNVREDEKFWIVRALKTNHLSFSCVWKPVIEELVFKEGASDNAKSSMPEIIEFNWYNTGLISLWFDDGFLSAYQNALPLMDDFSYKGAISIVVNHVDDFGYLNWSQLKALQDKGWETTSQSMSNSCDLGYYTSSVTEHELVKSQQTIKAHGLRAEQFVMPCGYSKQEIADNFVNQAPPIIDLAKQYYSSFRTINKERTNPLPLQDPYNLKAFEITKDTTDEEIQAKLIDALQNKTWLIFFFHQIDESNDSLAISKTRFKSILDKIRNSHLPVVLPKQVLMISSRPDLGSE